MTEPDAPLVKPAPRTARRRLLVLGGAGLAVLLAVVGVVNYRQRTAPLRPALFVQTPGSLGDIQFTRDGRLLMTTEGDASKPMVTFRDADTGQVVRQWPGGAGQKWLSADGTRFLETDYVLHGPSHSVLRDAVTGRVLRQWTGQIGSVRPDFTLMTVADSVLSIPAPPGTPLGQGKYIRPKTGQVVEVETGRVVGQFSLTNGYLGESSLSSTKPFLYLTDFNHPARLLRLPSMTPVLTGLPPLRSLQVTWDGTRAIGIDKTGVLHFWSLPSGQHTTVPTGLTMAFGASQLKSGELFVSGTQGEQPHGKVAIQVRSADGTRLLHSFSDLPQAFSPGGRLMAVTPYNGPGSSKTYAVWNLVTGKRQALLDVGTDAFENPVSDSGFGSGHLAIAPDGRQFVYAAQSGLLRFYRPGKPAEDSAPVSQDSGRSVLSFTGSLRDAVVLPGGGIAACGSGFAMQSNQTVQVWQPGQSAWSVTIPSDLAEVARLGVSPDGTQLVGSSQWGLWTLDLKTRVSQTAPIQAFQNPQAGLSLQDVGRPVWLDGPAQPVAVLSTGIFGAGPVLLTQWDAGGRVAGQKTVAPAKQTLGKENLVVSGVEVSPDGQMLAVLWNERGAGSLGKLELRETRSGRVLRTLASTLPPRPQLRLFLVSPRSAGALGQPAFSPDGTHLAAADDLGGVQVWDTKTGQRLGMASGTRPVIRSYIGGFSAPDDGGAARVAFTPDNRWLAVGRDDGSIYIYSLRSWLPVAQIGQIAKLPPPLITRFRWLAFAPDGRTLYGFTTNGTDVFSWPVPALKDRP